MAIRNNSASLLLLLPEIEPWTFEQRVGEAVIIPAGCPYQIRSPKVTHKALLTFLNDYYAFVSDFSLQTIPFSPSVLGNFLFLY